MTTPIEEFNTNPCEKIPGREVAAYFDLWLDDLVNTDLHWDCTWGEGTVDLTPAIKAGETVTNLEISNDDDDIPTYLRFNREDEGADCIHGADLSRIIYLQHLKDVSQASAPRDGDVYQFNRETNLFEPFALKSFVVSITNRVTQAEHNINTNQGDINTLKEDMRVAKIDIANLKDRMRAVEDRLDAIEAIIPFWPADKTMMLVRGTINAYADVSNSGSKTDGLFTHDKNTNKRNDLMFS